MKKKIIILSSAMLVVLTVICFMFNRQDHAADYFDGVQYIRVYQYISEEDSESRSDIILDSSYEEFNSILTAMQNAEPIFITNLFWGKAEVEKIF